MYEAKKEIGELSDYLKSIYSLDENYINADFYKNLQLNICEKTKSGYRNVMYIKIKEIDKKESYLESILRKKDIFYTLQPTFTNKSQKRNSSLANNSNLTACFCNFLIDIDIHNGDTEELESLENMILNSTEILCPTIINTGRGIQLIYSFSSISIKLEWLYCSIQDCLIDLVDNYLIENKVNTRVDKVASNKSQTLARLPFTINSKSKSIVRILRQGKTYTIDTLRDFFDPVIVEPKNNVIDIKKDLRGRQSVEELKKEVISIGFFYDRLNQLESKVNEIHIGCRHTYLLICYDTARLFKTEVESRNTVSNLNKMLRTPLDEKEVASIFSNTKAYKWKNDTIEAVLNIKLKKNKERDEKRVSKKDRAKRDKEIKRLYKTGKYTQGEIGEKFNLTRERVNRIINLKK